MKKLFILLLIATSFLCCQSVRENSVSLEPYPYNRRFLIAVLNFENKSDDPRYNGYIQAGNELLIHQLIKSGRFRIIERERLDQVMEEQKLSFSGLMDSQQMYQFGRLLGVDGVLLTTLTRVNYIEKPIKFGDGMWIEDQEMEVVLESRIIHVETGEILSAGVGTAKEFHDWQKIGMMEQGTKMEKIQLFESAFESALEKLASEIAKNMLGK